MCRVFVVCVCVFLCMCLQLCVLYMCICSQYNHLYSSGAINFKKNDVSLSYNFLGLKASEPKILTYLHFCLSIAGIVSVHYCGWLLKYRFWERIHVFILSIQTLCKLRHLLSLAVFFKNPKNVSCP